MKTKLNLMLIAMAMYLVGYGNLNYYSWVGTTMYSSAPTASVGSNPQFGDGNVWYVNSSNLITRLYPNANSWLNENITGIDAVKPNTATAYGDWKMYYVGNDNFLHSLWKPAGTWLSPVMNPLSDAVRGDALLFTENSTLFYANTGNSICDLQWDNTAQKWIFTNFGAYVKPGTSFAYGPGHLFFIDAQSKVRNMLPSGPTWWYDGGVLCPSAPAARGDGIVTGASGELFYISTDNNIVRLYWSGGWQYETIALTNKCGGGGAAPAQLVYDQGRLFYLNISSQPCVLLKDACEWYEHIMSQTLTASYQARIIFGSGQLFYANNSKMAYLMPTIDPNTYQYIYLKGKTFYNGNTAFYPKVMNYIVEPATTDMVNYWPMPCKGYANSVQYTSMSTATAAIVSQFTQIAGMGCNTVRIMGMAAWDTLNSSTAPPYAWGRHVTGSTYVDIFPIMDNVYTPKHFAMIRQILDIAQSKNLKVILCTGQGELMKPAHAPSYQGYLNSLAGDSIIRKHPALLAYDYYNEPMWVYSQDNKSDNCQFSADCFNAIRNNDFNHLITIGTNGREDLLTWDPATLSCDFYSFHLYSHLPATDLSFDDIRAAAFWIKKNIHDRPWIVGETGYSAYQPVAPTDNCRAYTYNNETDQKNFCIYTQGWTRGAGGSGYSWWQFHDVFYGFSDDYMGAISSCGRNKAVAGEFSNTKDFLNPSTYPCDNVTKPDSVYYYNIHPDNYVLTGKLVDPLGNPIEDALITGWDTLYQHAYNTYSRPNGTFSLWTATRIKDMRTSAFGKIKLDGSSGWGWNFAYTGASPGRHAVPTATLTNMTGCSVGGHRMAQSTNNHSGSMEAAEGLKIYPNPARDYFSINCAKPQEYTVTIYNLYGERLMQERFKGTDYSGSLASYPVGVYIVHVMSSDGSISKSTKVVHQ